MPHVSYLLRVQAALDAVRADLPVMATVADAAAAVLAGGGRLRTVGEASFVREMIGRAGGFMEIRPPWNEGVLEPQDVTLSGVAPGATLPAEGVPPGGWRITFGDDATSATARHFSSHAAHVGISPTLGNIIPAWCFTGELFAALTRVGKTPTMYESIGAYGGHPRMAKYQAVQRWYHDDLTVPPLPAGLIAGSYLDTLSTKLNALAGSQRASLELAGAWLRTARAGGHRLFMYSQGHLFPLEVANTAIATLFTSAALNAGFRGAEQPPDAYAPGDVVVFIGYQHPPDELLQRARAAGAQVVYATLRDARAFRHDPGALWLEPTWDWPDACVTVPGYDVPLLPASAVINGALAWECYRLAGGS